MIYRGGIEDNRETCHIIYVSKCTVISINLKD